MKILIMTSGGNITDVAATDDAEVFIVDADDWIADDEGNPNNVPDGVTVTADETTFKRPWRWVY